jgi:DNA-binding MarR family transcriptional regulator
MKKMELEEKIFSAMERIHTASRSALQKSVHGHGVSSLQAQIMHHIASRDSASVSQLAEHLKVSKPTISDAVAVLLDKKLVKKVIGAGDARSYHLALTAKGRTEATTIAGYAAPFLETLGELTDEQKQALWKALLQLLKTMQAQGLIPLQRMPFDGVGTIARRASR